MSFGRQLREIIQREPERLGAVAFLNSIEHKASLHNGGHLGQCMEAIIKNINAQNRLVKDLVTRLFSEDNVSKVPISLEMLLQAWGEDGSWCRRLGHELTTCFPMSWNTDDMRFSCTVHGCPGGYVCRKRAIEKITELIEEAAYGRKVVHPCLSRWWKFTPCARIILFGVAFFRLWRNAAPIKKKGVPAIEPVQIDGINIDTGDDWHAMHNWRVGAVFDFSLGQHCVAL